jgi:hypothetical protein
MTEPGLDPVHSQMEIIRWRLDLLKQDIDRRQK